MQSKTQHLKVMGPKAASLVRGLYDAGKETFSLADAANILEEPKEKVRFLVSRLMRAGVVARVGSGLYNLVPFELGSETAYLGNPFSLACEIAKKYTGNNESYFLSHASAMDLHQMITQPQLTVYISSPKRIRSRTVMGTEFRFIAIKHEHSFGTDEIWADKTRKVPVSDIERTIIDGLRLPGYCGGITEVAKGMWMKRKELDCEMLVTYAKRLRIGAVKCRLGYLLELFEMAKPAVTEGLRQDLSRTYHLFDPDLDPEGKHLARWRLRLNVTSDELLGIIRT